ncbi:2Fe-2S iron-sulfur cluster-binding protein [Haloarchaeobius amylolyticus]|uniref:2Fe-2S iron-sulfur cluster-binding protein n=1 Tax=Haloarchaeobius amylolyticus TaxID=1198296 RepID=UPI00226D4C53|nr:2Fe-2S iron-sulfur cluster-binding protein [Haloarchaeobius amylolyticus]
MAINELGLAIGLSLTVIAVVMHFLRGTAWTPTEDISQEVLERRASTVAETDFPEPMNRAIGGGGAAGAIAGGEAGGELEGGEDAEEESTSPADIPEDEVEYFDIEYTKEGATVEVANNETLLEAGEDEGWDLPYACRQGQCVSCAGHIADGGDSRDYVVHDNQEMLDDPELEDGYVLTCVAYPKAEFTIETNETP